MKELHPIDRELAKLDFQPFVTRKSQNTALRRVTRTQTQLKNMSRADIDLDIPMTKIRPTTSLNGKERNTVSDNKSKRLRSNKNSDGLTLYKMGDLLKRHLLTLPLRKLVCPKTTHKKTVTDRIRYIRGARGFTRRKHTGRLR